MPGVQNPVSLQSDLIKTQMKALVNEPDKTEDLTKSKDNLDKILDRVTVGKKVEEEYQTQVSKVFNDLENFISLPDEDSAKALGDELDVLVEYTNAKDAKIAPEKSSPKSEKPKTEPAASGKSKTEKPKTKKTAPSKEVNPNSKEGEYLNVGEMAVALVQETDKDGKGYSTEAIAERIRKHFINAGTTASSVSWYVSQIRKGKGKYAQYQKGLPEERASNKETTTK